MPPQPGGCGGRCSETSSRPKGKAMRKAVAISLLLLAMSAPAYADGNMGDPFAPPPPQAASTAQTGTEPTGGDMGNGVATAPDATTAATEAALSLLPALLSLV